MSSKAYIPTPRVTRHDDFQTRDAYIYVRPPTGMRSVQITSGVLDTATSADYTVQLAAQNAINDYLYWMYRQLPTIIRRLRSAGVPEYLKDLESDIDDIDASFTTLQTSYKRRPPNE